MVFGTGTTLFAKRLIIIAGVFHNKFDGMAWHDRTGTWLCGFVFLFFLAFSSHH